MSWNNHVTVRQNPFEWDSNFCGKLYKVYFWNKFTLSKSLPHPNRKRVYRWCYIKGDGENFVGWLILEKKKILCESESAIQSQERKYNYKKSVSCSSNLSWDFWEKFQHNILRSICSRVSLIKELIARIGLGVDTHRVFALSKKFWNETLFTRYVLDPIFDM